MLVRPEANPHFDTILQIIAIHFHRHHRCAGVAVIIIDDALIDFFVAKMSAFCLNLSNLILII